MYYFAIFVCNYFFCKKFILNFCLFNFHFLIVIKSNNLTIRMTDLPRVGPPTVGHPAGKMPKIDHLIVFAICVFLEYQSVSGPNYNYFI